jgi:phage I-like protein
VTYVVGKPIHIFPRGQWAAVDGRQVEFDDADAKAMLDDLKTRHSDVALTFDHETDKARGSEAAGWMPRDAFVFKADGLWNSAPLWVVDVYNDLISTGKFRYLSGDALGIGSASHGDAFHPRRLLAASLVPKPGFVRGLTGIQLAADEKAAIEAWLTPLTEERMAAKMTRAELCQQMGLKASATTEELKDAFSKFMDEEAEEPAHEEKAGAKATGEKFAHKKENCPDPENCDQDGHDEPDEDDKEAQMSAKAAGTLPGSTVEAGELEKEGAAGLAAKGLSAEDGMQFASDLGKSIAAEVVPAATAAAEKAATAAATKQVEATFAARKTAEEIDSVLKAAEDEGRLTAEKRESVRAIFSTMGMEKGKEVLGLMPVVAPTKPIAPENAFITGGVDSRVDLFVMGRTEAGRAERDEFLSASARWAAEKRIDWLSAMEAVRRGENKQYEAERKAAIEGRQAFNSSFRPSLRSRELDLDLINKVHTAMKEGKIPDNVFPNVQRFAALSSFQPAARTTLPMGLGFYQAPFIGTEILQEFVGGPDERAAWPTYGLEKFDGSTKAVGIGATPAESDLLVTWNTVNLQVYARTINIDRRSRAASVTLPEGLDTTAAENVRTQVETGKEQAIAAFMNTTANYLDSGFYTTLSGANQWSHASGVPLTNIPNAMAHVRKAVRTWPDLLVLSADAFIAIRRNPQVLSAVQYTGTLARPGQMVPIETLIALFGMSVVVGEAGGGVLPDGSDVADVWGQDAYIVVTGSGKVVAPRFGALITAGGYPKVRMWPREDRGANGADAITFSDAWNPFSVAKGAAYHWINASAAL